MQFACPVFSGLGDGFTDRGTQKIEDLVDAAFGKQIMGLDLRELRAKLPPAAGAVHYRFWQWQKAFAEIVARKKKFGHVAVCIVGHSYGCWAASNLARALADEAIDVEYMACIDPTALPAGAEPMWVPNTVEAVDEFWSGAGGWMTKLFNFPYAARERDNSGRSGGKMMYRPGAPSPMIADVPAGHIGTASHPDVHKRIVLKIDQVLDTID